MTRWFEVPLAGGPASEPMANATIDGLLINQTDSTLLGYLTFDGTRTRPVMFEPRLQTLFGKVYPGFSKLDATIVNSTPDFGKFIVLTRGNGESGTYYAIDVGAFARRPHRL